MSVLVLIEDDPAIRTALERALSRRGHAVHAAPTAMAGLELVTSRSPDVVVLDLGLPDVDGTQVLGMIRGISAVPVIVATARDDENEMVRVLDLGADDYVVKPFSAREVVARIRAVLRRTAAPEQPDDGPVEVGALRVDPARHEATLDGEPLELSRKEFELLYLLIRNAGSVVTRERLIDEVWDPNWFGSTKTLDVHVSGLRRKLGDDPAEPRYLHTVRGVGFRFSSPDEAE